MAETLLVDDRPSIRITTRRLVAACAVLLAAATAGALLRGDGSNRATGSDLDAAQASTSGDVETVDEALGEVSMLAMADEMLGDDNYPDPGGSTAMI